MGQTVEPQRGERTVPEEASERLIEAGLFPQAPQSSLPAVLMTINEQVVTAGNLCNDASLAIPRIRAHVFESLLLARDCRAFAWSR